jgi:hypothetical protein
MVDAGKLNSEIQALIRHDDGLTAETIEQCPQLLEALGARTGREAAAKLEAVVMELDQTQRVDAVKTALGIGVSVDDRSNIKERRLSFAGRYGLKSKSTDLLARQVRDNWERKGRELVVGKIIKLYGLNDKGEFTPVYREEKAGTDTPPAIETENVEQVGATTLDDLPEVKRPNPLPPEMDLPSPSDRVYFKNGWNGQEFADFFGDLAQEAQAKTGSMHDLVRALVDLKRRRSEALATLKGGNVTTAFDVLESLVRLNAEYDEIFDKLAAMHVRLLRQHAKVFKFYGDLADTTKD